MGLMDLICLIFGSFGGLGSVGSLGIFGSELVGFFRRFHDTCHPLLTAPRWCTGRTSCPHLLQHLKRLLDLTLCGPHARGIKPGLLRGRHDRKGRAQMLLDLSDLREADCDRELAAHEAPLCASPPTSWPLASSTRRAGWF